MYDYIIIGAGSAGCVLAERLSADRNHRVLLLEAGKPDADRNIKAPAAFSNLFKSEYDWAYETEPQANLNGRRLYWPRGKTLGGSGSLNAMIYIRGHRADYERWAALGNEEWGWDDVLPVFRRIENNERLHNDLHGADGPLNVADLRSIHPLSHAFVSAAVASGVPGNTDFNGARQTGAGFYQVTQKNGARWSTADAYLRPALARPNLVVETGAQAMQITFDGRRATGVAYRQHGRQMHVGARREVLLCGGAINSPQLLLLSGIGPADHLRDLGIRIVRDLPGVGQNLQDHLAAGIYTYSKQPITYANASTLRNLLRYLLHKDGPFSSNIAEAGLFIRTRPDLPQPDIQFHFGPVFYIAHGFGDIRPDEAHGYSLGPCLIQPKSRGQIALRTANPFDAPAIQPNYLDHPDDLTALLAGMKLGLQIAAAPPFDPYRERLHAPTPDQHDDAGLAAYIRAGAETLYHPVGTCKMGVDPQAVVDGHLRVHGVEGLRVVDASVMPTVIGGNTNAPTIMIAERAAEFMMHGD